LKLIRAILLALLGSLLIGFLIGTVIRLRMERPVRYLGVAFPVEGTAPIPMAAGDPAEFSRTDRAT
jgi:hypothetical protein